MAISAHARVWPLAGMMGASGRHVTHHPADQSGLVQHGSWVPKAAREDRPNAQTFFKVSSSVMFANVSLAGTYHRSSP